MEKGWMRHLDFIIVDFLSIAATYGAGVILTLLGNQNRDIGISESTVVFILLHFSVAFLTEAYEGIVGRGHYREFVAVLRQCVSVGVCFAIYHIYDKNGENIALEPIFYFCFWWMILMYAGRLIWKKYLLLRYADLRNSRRVLVVTTKAEAKKMVEFLTANPIRNYDADGFVIVDEDMKGQMIGTIPVKANRADLMEYLEEEVIDEALMNIPGDPEYEWRLANEFLIMGIIVHIYMQRQYEKLPNRHQGRIFGYDVLTTSISRITFRQMLLKRLTDIAGSIVGLVITGVVGIFIGPVIYFESPGPIVFSQIRVGKGGRKFRLYKFRSMYMDAEERKKELMTQNEMKGLMFKIKDDPRIIKGIGHFIRKTSLDEFPQFWNVLKGDMSLVGTRPPTVDEYEKYEAHHRRRLSMKPGITGLWQISGRNDIMDFEEVVKLDVEYIEHYSLELDIKILVKTVLSVLKRDGAS